MLGSPDASPVFGTTGLDNADFPGFGADILGTAVFGASGNAPCSPFSRDHDFASALDDLDSRCARPASQPFLRKGGLRHARVRMWWGKPGTAEWRAQPSPSTLPMTKTSRPASQVGTPSSTLVRALGAYEPSSSVAGVLRTVRVFGYSTLGGLGVAV